MRIKDLLFGLATFCVGVVFAGTFPLERAPQLSVQQKTERTYFLDKSESCTERKIRIDTERGHFLEDKIRELELKLIKLRSVPSNYSAAFEKKISSSERRLEAELQILGAERNHYLRETFAALSDAKLVYRQVCSEN